MYEFFGIADELPDPNAKGLNLDRPCPVFGWPNMITNAVSGAIAYPEHSGPLSIKCSFGGRQIYETAEGRHEVDDASYLILNNGQRYEHRIEEGTDVKSFCLFFQPAFPARIYRDLVTPDDTLLDLPYDTSDTPGFFEQRYRHDSQLSPLLFRLYHATQPGKRVDRLWLGEQFHAVLGAMLHVHRTVCRDVNSLTAVKASTRIERYRRLQLARDYIDDNYNSTLTISEIASVACLSTHHFLRSFKQLFHVTPYQYITMRRVEAAQRLLKTTDLPVSAICYDLGFESPSSFSGLFRRRTGVSPEQYRFGSTG